MKSTASSTLNTKPSPHGKAVAIAPAIYNLDWLVIALVATVLCTTLLLIVRPLQTVFDRPLIEDGFYVLSVARQIALGHGVTYNGATLSNGFQPLWVVLCAPLFWLADGDRVSGIRLVVAFHWVLYGIGSIFISVLAKRIFIKVADPPKSMAYLTALVFLSSALVWMNSFNGLETSLAVVCLLASILCYISIDREKWLHYTGCGIVLGLLVLARIDAVFFVIFLTIIQLLRRDAWNKRIVNALCLAGPAFLISSPWWASNIIAFGHLTPSSGLALQDWAPTPSRYLIGVAALVRSLTPQLYLSGPEIWPVGIARAAVIGAAVYWTWPSLREFFRSLDRSAIEVFAALSLFIITLAVWYPTSSGASFFYTRYLAPASIIATLFWAFVIFQAVQHLPRFVTNVGFVLMAAQIPIFVSLAYTATGYRVWWARAAETMLKEQVPLVHAHVPPDDWVAAGQSGTLGFLRDRVVNLDGRVNFEALDHRHDIPRYLREKDIRWIADWSAYVTGYLGSEPARLGWSHVATNGSMLLYRYDGMPTPSAARSNAQ
jgi:hypothetical protein